MMTNSCLILLAAWALSFACLGACRVLADDEANTKTEGVHVKTGATVGAEAQDRENDLEDEAEDPNPDHGNHWSLTEDSEPDYDNEYDFRRERVPDEPKLPVVRVRRAKR